MRVRPSITSPSVSIHGGNSDISYPWRRKETRKLSILVASSLVSRIPIFFQLEVLVSTSFKSNQAKCEYFASLNSILVSISSVSKLIVPLLSKPTRILDSLALMSTTLWSATFVVLVLALAGVLLSVLDMMFLRGQWPV